MNITTQNDSLLRCLFINPSFDDNSQMYGALVFSSVLNSVLAVTASSFNALVLLTIWKKPSLQTPTNCLLACLAVSDLGVGALVQPLSALYVIVHIQRRFLIYCILGLLTEGLGLLLAGVSLLTLAAISIEKYLAIYLHLRYKQIVTVSRTKKAIFVLWVIPVSCVACRFLYEDFRMLMTLGIVYLSLCISIIFICNVSIGKTLRRLTIRVHTENTPQLSTAMGIARFKKSVLTMLYVVGLFVLCFVPYGVAMILAIKFGFPVWIRKMNYVTFPFVFLNSTLNPVLYWWRLSELRSATLETALGLWNKVAFKKRREAQKTKKTETKREISIDDTPQQSKYKESRKNNSETV